MASRIVGRFGRTGRFIQRRRAGLAALIAVGVGFSALAGASPKPAVAALLPSTLVANWRITDPGCCSGFSWSRDGESVTYFDRDPRGIGVLWGLNPATGRKRLESRSPKLTSPSGRYVLERRSTDGSIQITDTLLDRSWVFDRSGRSLLFSRDEDRVAFGVRQPGALPRYARPASIYVSGLEGTDRRFLTQMIGGPIAWLPGGDRLLLSGRQSPGDQTAVWIYDLKSDALRKLFSADFLRGTTVSPDGRFIAFFRTLDRDPSQSGLWVYDTATSMRRRIEPAGSYRWHPSSRGLLVIPPRPRGDGDHGIWWVDIVGGESVLLTESTSDGIRISNFEWILSPEGGRAAYRHADDFSLWVVDFQQALDITFSGPVASGEPSLEVWEPSANPDDARP